MRSAVIEIEFEEKDYLDIIFRSVKPEVEKEIPKTKVSIEKIDNKMILRIESKETSSLRAACNSFLRWIETARSVRDVIEVEDN